MSDRKMRIEVLVAYPPTDKCRAILSMAQEAADNDRRIRLDIYESGSAPLVRPTSGWMKPPPNADHAKFKKIPSIYVNGCPLACGVVPEKEAFLRMVAEQLEEEWQE